MDNKTTNFIEQIIQNDLDNKKYKSVVMRFPPEPNGFLHIGHAKAIFLNNYLAKKYNGVLNLRFDDTNPETEEQIYIDAIKEDLKWLKVKYNNLYYSSDYFQKLYDYAILLIKKNKAFVCQLTPEQIKQTRGSLKKPGSNSPYREQSIDENLKLFKEMKNGEFAEGSASLRAKIDMSHPNINMRDPVIYRIKKQSHIRSKDKWIIYPMYDFTHPLSDSIEYITHSLCTLEFEDHRLIYDWFIKELGIHHPQQIEFARLNIQYTVMSKRVLKKLVEKKIVKGWDDPRMPTISGMKNRGYPPEAIESFCHSIGVTKKNSIIALETLEHFIREHLNKKAKRAFAVFDKVKITIENWPEDKFLEIEVKNHPFEDYGTRSVIFSKHLYIERDDFQDNPDKNFFRLKPNGHVRLKYAYVITCKEVIKGSSGQIKELICTYHKDTFAGAKVAGLKTKSIIHWVSADRCIKAKVNLYDRLFKVENPQDSENLLDAINENSLVEKEAVIEEAMKNSCKDSSYQFERLGYFCHENNKKNSELTFNQIVTLKDSWKKINT